MDNDIFGIYDESFDLDRDGKLDAVEFDYMMEEFDKASQSTIFGDDSYLLDDDEDEDEDEWDDEDGDDSWEDSDDEDDWDDSDDDDWDDESDDY